jgi:hypothetical protein
MSESENLRALSRKGWLGAGALEEINAGSLQRIADATELMAKRHTERWRARSVRALLARRQTRREQLSAPTPACVGTSRGYRSGSADSPASRPPRRRHREHV